jgi:succinate-semialdehyde dehydrogenase
MSHCIQDPASTANTQVQELVEKARIAQAAFESFSQEQVDSIVKGIGKYVFDNAEMLARMAVDETGIGVYEDKILKNKGKARNIWNNLKDKKSRGIIGEDPDTNMVFVAKPMGVVAAVTPITNPIVTPMCNAMFAIKTGNAVIFAPHPKAEKCMELLTREFMNVVKANGGPDHLLQTIKNGSIETTQELMKVVDVVVATGGGAMVKSAYSSGKPSFGVGAGNVPVIIDTDADHKEAAGKIVQGASFDNGIICSHEQFVLVHESRYMETIQLFEATGKVWFTEDEVLIQKFRDLVFPGGRLNKDVVGRSCRDLGAMIGVEISEAVRIILLPAKGAGEEDVLAKEKLCPVVAILPYKDFKEAVAQAKANLIVEGAGHSAGLHSHNENNIRYAGLELPVSRLVVNQACSFSAGGSLTNGFAPTTTLGCGSWGGNSISENLDYKHLMNVSRIGKLITDKKVPTDAEIWA